jgi:prepilin-type processing-associated H-X9-DG protein
MAPMGLGFLVSGNYIGDVRSFYCPSTGGAMRPDCEAPAPGGTCTAGATSPTPVPVNKIWYPCGAACGLRNFQQAGGFDWKSIGWGNWQTMPTGGAPGAFHAPGFANVPGGGHNNNNSDWVGRAIECDYNYRNVVGSIANAWFQDGTGGWQPGDQLPNSQWSVRIATTKPYVSAQAGCPQFKTDKVLGNRAIVSDSFSAEYLSLNSYQLDGKGQYAHRDGYNVLYGDSHVTWYGDPAGNIMFSPAANLDVSSNWTVANMWSLKYCALTNYYLGGGSHVQCVSTNGDAFDPGGGGDFTDKPSSQDVWHQFDMHNGIDVDAQ